MSHVHDDRCQDRPSLRPGRRIPVLGGVTWGWHRDRDLPPAWGFRTVGPPRRRYAVCLGQLTVWVGPW